MKHIKVILILIIALLIPLYVAIEGYKASEGSLLVAFLTGWLFSAYDLKIIR